MEARDETKGAIREYRCRAAGILLMITLMFLSGTSVAVTRPGGSIDANIKLRADGAEATLHTVNAQLGVGGTYRGIAITKD